MTNLFDLSKTAEVPCGKCTACCQGQILILPEHGDDPTLFETVSTTNPRTGFPALAIRQVEGGRCIYLKDGCSVYDHRPAVCKSFDCREFYAVGKDETGLEKIWLAAPQVLEAGRRLTCHQV